MVFYRKCRMSRQKGAELSVVPILVDVVFAHVLVPVAVEVSS